MYIEEKIKILHIFGGLNKGGSETLIMNVYRNIDRKKFQFDFAVEDSEHGDYEDEIINLGGKVHRFKSSNGRFGISRISNLNRILKYGSYDVVHSHVSSFNGINMMLAAKNKVPVRISHNHNSHDGQKDTFIRNSYRQLMRTLILKNATNLLGCSSQACEALYGLNCWEDMRSQVIPNGIDLSVFGKHTCKKHLIRKELAISKEAPVIGHVGRFVESKNHKFIVKIFAELLKDIPEAHLILVGEGPLKEKVIQLVKSKGIESRVHMLGVRSDIPEILADMDVLLFPSFHEGLGIVLVEAQAASLPCLISDAVPKEVDMGLNLIRPLSLNYEVSIWVQQLKGLITDTVPNVGQTLQQIRNKGYSIGSTVDKLVQIYTRTGQRRN